MVVQLVNAFYFFLLSYHSTPHSIIGVFTKKTWDLMKLECWKKLLLRSEHNRNQTMAGSHMTGKSHTMWIAVSYGYLIVQEVENYFFALSADST